MAAKKDKDTIKETKPKNFSIQKKHIKWAIAAILIAAIAYLLKGYFIAATVNGQPVSRLEVVNRLEEAEGAAVLDNLIANKLIEQEARNRGIVVSEEEIQSEIDRVDANFQAQGQSLQQVLELQGLDINKVKDQIRLQLKAEKLLEEKINISEEDITNYLEENSEFIEGDSEEERQNQAREALRQEQLNIEFSNLIQQLKSSANINYWVDY